jgi:hypothetical protein
MRTKSGRLVKRPDRYVPTEKVEDDYATDEHDTDDEDEDDSDILSSEDDDDSDTEGSLVDFIVPDEEEDEE